MDSIVVNTIDNQPIDIYWQDEVELQLDLNLMYIKSGQKEIEDYVENVSKPEISDYVETEAKPLVSRIVTEIAEPTVTEYIETTVKPEIDDYVEEKKPELQAFVNTAQGFANDSQASAEASAASAAAALLSANNAEESETNAKSSETKALQYANQAQATATAFDTHAAEKQSQFDSNAAEKQLAVDASASAAAQSANNAEIWAEGTDAQVQALGGSKSAKGWAEASTNLNYTNITNCITAIPQDIKTEATDTTIILKSGSKVYDGNGLLSTLSSDSTSTVNMFSGTKLVFYEKNRNTTISFLEARCGSGDSLPADSTDYDMFYLTTDKKVYRYSGSWTSSSGYSLPIGKITTDGSKITDMEIFNGFGYIGNTVFALPGVEGLIPNRFNTDGSLNSTSFTTTSVLTFSFTNETGALNVRLNGSAINPTGATYDEDTNYVILNGAPISFMICGTVTCSSGRITSFNPKPVFQAQDYHTAARVGDDNVFTGNNTFEDTIVVDTGKDDSINIRSHIIDKNIKPLSNQFSNYINLLDINGELIGRIFATRQPSGLQGMSIQAFYGSRNTQVGVLASETKTVTYVSTPPASDNSTQIANTAWVRNLFTKSLAQNGYIKIPVAGSTSSLIIQWGYQESARSGTITFPTSFSSTNYGLGFMCITVGTGAGALSVTYTNPQTTSFDWASRCGGGGNDPVTFKWIAIGY